MRLFFALTTQWRHVALSQFRFALVMKTGIDYSAIPVAAGALGLTLDAQLLGQLQVLEVEAKEILAEVTQRNLPAAT